MAAFAGLGVWALIYSFIATMLVKTLLLMRIGYVKYRPLLHFRVSDIRGYAGFGLFQLGERSVNYISERLDQILIGPLLGATALGYYNFAFNLTARPVSRINPMLTRVAFPVFSKVQDDGPRLQKGYLTLVSFLTTINAPLLVGLAASAPVAVPLIFGNKWSPAVVLIQILSFASLSRSIGNPIGSLQLAKGRADLGFWWNLLLLIASAPTVYVGAHYGPIGVAIGLLLLQIALQIPSYLYLIRPLIGGCARGYTSVTLIPTCAACLMGFAVLTVPSLSMGRGVTLAIQIVLGAGLYILLVRTFHKESVSGFRVFSS